MNTRRRRQGYRRVEKQRKESEGDVNEQRQETRDVGLTSPPISDR